MATDSSTLAWRVPWMGEPGKTPHFHCREHGFNPWLGNLRSRMPCSMAPQNILVHRVWVESAHIINVSPTYALSRWLAWASSQNNSLRVVKLFL